jgi:1-acyl-sn-glycerol-3-phosphate acyltransferase
LPFVIQYEEIDGRPVTARNRDLLCWYGDMPFGPHLLKMLACQRIRIRIRVLPEIPVAGDSSRDTIADKAFDDVRNSYQPVT